ncbi:uncharacterized protein PGRI_036000 [Penicillium griseofulvum]|uniref:Peptidase C14 caspase domain-containing protein n=1 Tax=Penicillium patulum TaxID=5078 RepID=A0A135LD12_PENPA|nr:uncharacterized protein PGRI_036000 [Penicillium griseofulvum]KXG46854.1 hypothetical protein PGRI_036000 [Penicillium griseofulvum]
MESSESKPPTSPNTATSPVPPKSPSKIPRRISTKRIPLPELKSALERAVKARGNTYSQITAFVCYWDDDNTRAAEDGETFSHMMADIFGVATQTYIMNHENPTPGWDLGDRLHQEVVSKHRIHRPTLFIFFYAGHGTINQNNQLSFTATKKKKSIPWRSIESELIYHPYTMNTLCILDCCYSGTATVNNPMTTHVLAACSSSASARSRVNGISFTQRLVQAMRKLSHSGKISVSTDEIFDAVQNDTPRGCYMPGFWSHSGENPIVLPFHVTSTSTPPSSGILSSGRVSSSSLGNALHSRPPSQLPSNHENHVLILLVLEGNPKLVVKDFEKVVENLPAKFKVKITDAYEANASVGIFLRMSWEAYARFSSSVELDAILPVIGPSLIRTNELRKVSVPAGRENIPFRDRSRDKT